MLKILDRYIIKKFLATFFFVVLIFSMIAVIIDFSQNVEEFIDEKLGPWQVSSEYYFNFIVFINGLLWPLFAMIAVIFFTSRMAFNSEIIAILNAGVSFRRFIRPYLIAGGLLACLHLVLNHFVIPVSNKTRLDFFHAYIVQESDKGNTRDVHMFVDSHTKIYVRDYFKRDSFARNFRLGAHSTTTASPASIEADEARWDGKTGKWQLSNYEIHTFDGQKEGIVVGGKEKLDTALLLTPEDFVRYDDTREKIPSNRLSAFIDEDAPQGRRQHQGLRNRALPPHRRPRHAAHRHPDWGGHGLPQSQGRHGSAPGPGYCAWSSVRVRRQVQHHLCHQRGPARHPRCLVAQYFLRGIGHVSGGKGTAVSKRPTKCQLSPPHPLRLA